MAKSPQLGRIKGGRNRGFFFRKGRGWFAKVGSQFFPLVDEDGKRLRERQWPLSGVPG